MGQQAKASQQMTDLGGQQSASDPHDLPPGTARVQVNATCLRPSELTVRAGFRVVTFEES